MNSIRILSMNCRGLAEQKKRRDVMHYIRNSNFNVVFLQDTHITLDRVSYFNSLWKGKCYHSCFSSRSRGSCILFSTNTQHDVIKEINSDCGNYVIVICKINTEVFAFISIYGPNSDQPKFFQDIFARLENIQVDHMIMGGDMNFIMNPEMDCLNYAREHNVNARRTFIQLMDEYGLVDIWRHLNPSVKHYTWTRRNPFKCGRLDMFYVSEHLVSASSDVNIIAGYKTDHSAITLSIETKQPSRGNGLWMFNVSHLQHKEYIDCIKKCIEETVKQYAAPLYEEQFYLKHENFSSIHLTINDCLFYETLIMMLRGESIQFSKRIAKQNRSLEDQLKRNVDRAQEKFNKSSLEDDLNALSIAKEELEKLRRPIIEGLIVRSRVAWHEQGERNSKYFLSLEKRNGCAKSITFIKHGNRILSNTESILQEFSRNLENKYSKTNEINVNEDLITKNISNTIKPDVRLSLESEITLQELTEALNKMKKGKTPGSNGFPAEFFRTFWSELGPFLHRAFIASLTQNQNFSSHREGIIKYIPKQGKSPNEIKGWRPITLLNVDYKIVSSAIANRLKKVINDIISPSQTSYIAGRYIGENTRVPA